jgi:hypothetical protein
MDENYNSLGLEGNQEKYDENVKYFLSRIEDFKSKSWESIGHVVDVSVTNFVLLEHFLTIIVTKMIEKEFSSEEKLKDKKIEEVFQNLLDAFSLYKDDILEILNKERRD